MKTAALAHERRPQAIRPSIPASGASLAPVGWLNVRVLKRALVVLLPTTTHFDSSTLLFTTECRLFLRFLAFGRISGQMPTQHRPTATLVELKLKLPNSKRSTPLSSQTRRFLT